MAAVVPPAGWPDALPAASWMADSEDESPRKLSLGAKRALEEDKDPSCYPTGLRPGKQIATQICADVAESAVHLRQAHGLAPYLAIIEVGQRGANATLKDLSDISELLESGPKQTKSAPAQTGPVEARVAEHHGIRTRVIRFSETVPQGELLWVISQLMEEWTVHGILVQLPLPAHLDEQKVLSAIGPEKDVYGFCPTNEGLLCHRRTEPLTVPPVAAAVVEILTQSKVPLLGKDVVVLGRSSTVGTPVALMLQKLDCTVTVCHSLTKNVEEHVRRADVVIACVGKPEFVRGSWLKKGAVVVDVGTNVVSVFDAQSDERCTRRRIVGDVAVQEVKEGLVTPVPGGVAQVALAFMLRNVVNLARSAMNLEKMAKPLPIELGMSLEPQDRIVLRASPDQVCWPELGLRVPRVCLPRQGTDMTRWGVIACDQYTSQKKYWEEVEQFVGNAPSTLNLIFPEVYLGKGKDDAIIKQIHSRMHEYDRSGILESYSPGFVLVDRKTPIMPSRNGLMVELDLDLYSYAKGSQSLIRATEKTIEERLPPRVAIRERSSMELPHILVLIDDPSYTVIEPLVKNRDRFEKIYDFELMKGAGHLTGHRITSRTAIEGVVNNLKKLADPALFQKRYGATNDQGVLLFAVGDGNHSLATAKVCWEELKRKGASDEHPARYALVELMNIHDPGLQFEPIHRLVFDVDPKQLLEDARAFFNSQGMVAEVRHGDKHAIDARSDGHYLRFRWGAKSSAVLVVKQPTYVLAAATLTAWLDPYLARQPQASVDYVHGQEVINENCAASDRTVGILLPAMDKNDLIKTVVKEGVLPRKTFSMGEADEKRFYVEARRIVPETTFFRADCYRGVDTEEPPFAPQLASNGAKA